jgi:NADPH-dependent F420 reductase
MKIAIIGGTGKEGRGLAFRWAKAGHEVVIGSRQSEKAIVAADVINDLLTGDVNRVVGLENIQAAEWSEVIVLTVPFTAHVDMLTLLKDVVADKIFIDVTVPIVPPKVTVVQMPEAGSAGKEAMKILGPEAKVAIAFQNISYERLITEENIDCDVLVCGNGKDTRTVVLELVKDAGMAGWDAGPMANAMVVEGLTSILININKNYGGRTAGIRITGVDR